MANYIMGSFSTTTERTASSTIALTVVKRGKCPDIFSAAIPPIWEEATMEVGSPIRSRRHLGLLAVV